MTPRSLGRYEVSARIGEGGMGVVYLARDPALKRDVAVKVLRDDLPVRKERFHREIEVAAKLHHPNIVPVHDAGESSGSLYFVMPLIEGQTLRQRLEADGKLPLGEALHYASDIADALEYAHRRGVVHRDIKPENILLSDRRALVADFGLALVLDRSDPRMTRSDVAVGTLLYMSPEQAAGERDVDGRTDIYSLGCIVYEMLTGAPPRPRGAVAPISEARDDVPEALERAVRTALATAREDRFASAQEFARALSFSAQQTKARFRAGPTTGRHLLGRRIASAVAVLALAAGLVALSRRWQGVPEETTSSMSLAVLPIENLTGESSNDYLAAGFGDVLTTNLASVRGLLVLPRSETSGFLPSTSRVKEVSSKLGVSLIVVGSLQRSGEDLRVSLGLTGTDPSLAWSGQFDGTLEGLFELQQKIVTTVIDELERQAVVEAAGTAFARTQLRRGPTPDREAFDEYLKGRLQLEQIEAPGNLEESIRRFASAVGRDPGFALAHAALGEAYWLRYRRDRDPNWTVKARDAALEALRLNPERAAVRYTLALIYRDTGRPDDALDELSRVLELQPASDEARRLRGRIYSELDRHDEAVSELEQALSLRRSAVNLRDLGLVLFRARRLPEAIRIFEEVTAREPDNPSSFQRLGTAYHGIGDLEEALRNYELALSLAPSATAYSNIGTLHYARGRFTEAVEAYEAALELRPNSPSTYRNLGDALFRRGDKDPARRAYERAMALAREALELNPRDPRQLSLVALCQAKLGDFAEAIEGVKAARILAPEDAEVLYDAAAVHALAGRSDDAFWCLEEALERGYGAVLVQSDSDFDGLRGTGKLEEILRRYPPGGAGGNDAEEVAGTKGGKHGHRRRRKG